MIRLAEFSAFEQRSLLHLVNNIEFVNSNHCLQAQYFNHCLFVQICLKLCGLIRERASDKTTSMLLRTFSECVIQDKASIEDSMLPFDIDLTFRLICKLRKSTQYCELTMLYRKSCRKDPKFK